jgi:hypothetical protein
LNPYGSFFSDLSLRLWQSPLTLLFIPSCQLKFSIQGDSAKVMCLRKLSDHYGGNSSDRKKPNLNDVETILREFGAAPSQVMVVGDSEIEVQTARNAGTWIYRATAWKAETLLATWLHISFGRSRAIRPTMQSAATSTGSAPDDLRRMLLNRSRNASVVHWPAKNPP